MKKLLLILPILMLGFVLVACNNDDETDANEPDVEEVNAVETDADEGDSGEDEDVEESTDETTDEPEAGTNGNLTLQDAIDAFVAAGVEVDPDDRPLYQIILASDGVQFSIDGSLVSIYEFSDEAALAAGLEAYAELTAELAEIADVVELQINGLLALETSNEQAIEIFNNLE